MKISEVRISTKGGAMIAAGVLCLACTCAAALDFSYRRMTADRIGKARAVVDMTTNLAGSLEQQVQAGTLTRDAALVRFRETVAAQHYDGENYVFAFDYDGAGIVDPALPGAVGNRTGLDLRDARGLHFIAAITGIARHQGSGETTYYLPHLGKKTAVRKISVV